MNLLLKGDCLPCPRVSKQKCLCGRKVSERLCASPTWQCDVVSYLSVTNTLPDYYFVIQIYCFFFNPCSQVFFLVSKSCAFINKRESK